MPLPIPESERNTLPPGKASEWSPPEGFEGFLYDNPWFLPLCGGVLVCILLFHCWRRMDRAAWLNRLEGFADILRRAMMPGIVILLAAIAYFVYKISDKVDQINY